MVEGTVKFARNRWVPPAALVFITFTVYARSIVMPLVYYDSMAYIFEDLRIAVRDKFMCFVACITRAQALGNPSDF